MMLSALLLAVMTFASSPASSSSGSSSGDGAPSPCDCDAGQSIGAVLTGPRACLLRAALAPKQAAAAAKAVRARLRSTPSADVRGGSGADVASFDGGGGERKPAATLLDSVGTDVGGKFFTSAILPLLL